MAIKPVPIKVNPWDESTGQINLTWQSYFNSINTTGLSFAPTDATYIIQSSNVELTNAITLSTLQSGFLKVATGSGTLSSTGFELIQSTDLTATGVTPNTYGSATFVPRLTVDAQGRLTDVTSVLIEGVTPSGAAGGDLSNTYPNPSVVQIQGIAVSSTNATAVSNLTGTNSGDQTITLTGDVTGSGTGTFAATLANTAVTPGSYTYNGNAYATVDSKGRLTSINNITINDAVLITQDTTSNDVSALKHGFAPKAPNDANKYLDGTGGWSIPPGSGSGTVNIGTANFAAYYASTGTAVSQLAINGTLGNLVATGSPAITTPTLVNPIITQSGGASKNIAFDTSGATSSKTATIVSSHTNDRSITLPDATDTLVGKATTDTLTNKTLTTPVINGTITGTTVFPVANGGNGVTALPSFIVYDNSGTSIPATSTYTKIAFDTEVSDPSNYYDTTNKRWLPLIAGTYSVSFLLYGSPVSNILYVVALYKNGSLFKVMDLRQTTVVSAVTGFQGTCLVPLNGSTDYIEMFMYNGSAVTAFAITGGSNNNYWCGNWVGP